MTPKPIAKKSDLKYWQERGTEDTWFQRQAQTTWWSVLGGIAIGILVTQISPVIEALKTSHWYTALYFIATLLVVTYSWVTTSWGSLVLHWPITIPGSLNLLISTMACAFAALNLTNPPMWMAALAVAAISSFFMRLYFYLSSAWVVFSQDNQRSYKIALVGYGAFALIVAGFAVHTSLVPTETVFKVYSVISLIFSIGLLVWEQIGMTAEKRMLNIP